jgi:putative transcriptional regulator
MITNVSAPCLLVGMPSMLDGNFIKSVLLLAEHNSEGAIAFILNRPSTVPLKSMVSLIDRDVPSAIPAWYGGPVDTGTAIILHSRKPANNDTDVGQGIYLSTSGRILDSLLDESAAILAQLAAGATPQHENNNPYRFLVGYAGWSKGQLDDEIRTGAWALQPMDRDLVFNTPWADMWTTVTTRMGLVNRKSLSMPLMSTSSYLN